MGLSYKGESYGPGREKTRRKAAGKEQSGKSKRKGEE